MYLSRLLVYCSFLFNGILIIHPKKKNFLSQTAIFACCFYAQILEIQLNKQIAENVFVFRAGWLQKVMMIVFISTMASIANFLLKNIIIIKLMIVCVNLTVSA